MNKSNNLSLFRILFFLVISVSLCSSCDDKEKEKPIVVEQVSNRNERMNAVNPPRIEFANSIELNAWNPEVLSINFSSGNSLESPVIFEFSLPMVHKDSLDQSEFPDIQIDPAIKGTFKWESPTKLSFQPNQGELTYGQIHNFRIETAVPMVGEIYALPYAWERLYTVPYFRMAGKVANWPVIYNAPRFINFLNWNSRKIGDGPVYLLYDQPIEISTISKNLVVQNADGTNMQYTAFRPDDIKLVFDKEIDLEYVIGIQVEGLPDEGEDIIIQVPQWDSNKNLYVEERYLTVHKEFKIIKSYANYYWAKFDYFPLNLRWHVTSSHWVSLAQFEKAFSIEPEPKSIRFSNSADYDYENNDYSSAISKSTAQLELEAGTEYKITISDDLTDVLGNKIDAGMDTTFRTVDLPPVLHTPREAILIEKGVTTFPIRTQNLKSIKAKVYQFRSPEHFAKALILGKRADIIQYGLKSPGKEVSVKSENSRMNIIEDLKVDLDEDAGLFCAKIDAEGTGSEAEGSFSELMLVQSSNIGITSKIYEGGIFIWVTSLDKASPMSGMKIKLYDGKEVVKEGTTDQNGVVSFEANSLITSNRLNQKLFVIAANEDDVAVAQLNDKEFSNAWQFGLQGKVRGFNPLNAVVFTERGVYRPGEKVHLKVIAEELVSNAVKIRINDPRGQQVLNQDVTLDDFNSASIEIDLKKQAPVGQYSISVSANSRSTTRSFKVEEYRVPTFQVNVFSDKEDWNINEQVKTSIEAKYLHGGTLDGREVKWMVSRTPIPFTSKSFPQYIFSWKKSKNYAGVVISGNKRLDGNGKLRMNFTPDHPPSVGAMQYTVEATATDVDRQAYAGRISKIIHPADFYIGLKPPSRSILSVGEKLTLPVIALSPEGKIVEGEKINVLLERIDHHTAARMSPNGNVQMLNRQEAEKLTYYEIKSKESANVLEFDLTEAGQYRINAWTEDKNKKLVQAGFEFTVSGDNPIAWPRFDQERIEVITDKESYKIGEVAEIVVQSPYESATGILTIERDDVISYQLFDIDKNTPKIQVPIEDEYAPNVYVSLLLIRGRIHNDKDATGFETGAPGIKLGYTNLKVEPENKLLDVSVAIDKTTAIPGEEVQITLGARDNQNAPVEGQVTLMVVDEAVLGLTSHQTPDPLTEMYSERLLGTRTGSNLLDLPHSKRSRLEKIFPGGDMDNGNLFAKFPAELRKLFESTAYYNPNVLLDKNGNATVNIKLPDNLTTFRVMAIAVDKALSVGATDAQIQVSQPLMVQPVLPRFVYPEDELKIEALVFNGTNGSSNVELNAEFEGFEVTSGGLSKTMKIHSQSSEKTGFQGRVGIGDELVVRYSASNGNYSDAVEVKIPILEPGTKEVILENKRVANEDQISIELPADHIDGSASLEIVLSTSNLSELKDAVQYLMRYPNGCIEQTTSTAYPLVVLKDLLPVIGVEVDMADLKKFSEAGVRRILSFQTPTGGLSYWPGSDKPHAFATAFGLTALIEAKKKGYDVSNEALEGMANYLEKSLRQGKISDEMPHGGMADADTRALFVMTLGRLGRPQPGYISILWQKKEQLTPFGLSFLAIAIKENPGDQSLLRPVLAEIKEAASQDADQAWYESSPKGGWSFDSPLRTHASALLAFASSDTEVDMTGKYLKGLLSRRKRGMWGNTQENVFGIMGVYETAVNEVGEKPGMQLMVNGQLYDNTQMEQNSTQTLKLNLSEEDLQITEGSPSEQLVSLVNQSSNQIIFTVRLQYDVPLTPENMQPVENGFLIERRYETLEGESIEGDEIKLGSLVRVRVNVKTNDAHHYVAIDDKLPAGLEPLNTSLATTEQVDQGELTNTAQRSLSVLSYSEIRDSRVAFYVDEMIAGEYEYTYVARATSTGKFLRPAGLVEAMYQPQIFGKTETNYITISE